MANTKQIQWQFGILLSQSVLAIFVLIIFCLFIMVSNFSGLVVEMCLYVSCNFTFLNSGLFLLLLVVFCFIL